MGNHEELALAARHGGHYEEHWLRNGGDETLRSYGVTKAIELPVTHVTWIDSLPLQHDDGLRFFVHAGIDPNRPLNEQSPHDLLWIRGPFLADERVYERYIVHGHSPLLNRKPDQRANRLNLDTAAVLGGPLTAGVFDDKQIEPICFLQAN
jgi:serine/threonine protein phosphatase 1